MLIVMFRKLHFSKFKDFLGYKQVLAGTSPKVTKNNKELTEIHYA